MPTKKDAAKTIANEAFKRRREAQYAALLRWKNGIITGVQCLDEIEYYSNLIMLQKTDFTPSKPSTPTQPGKV